MLADNVPRGKGGETQAQELCWRLQQFCGPGAPFHHVAWRGRVPHWARAPAGWTASAGGEWAHSLDPKPPGSFRQAQEWGSPFKCPSRAQRGAVDLVHPTRPGPHGPSVILYLFDIQLAVQGAGAAPGSPTVPPGQGRLPPPAAALVQAAALGLLTAQLLPAGEVVVEGGGERLRDGGPGGGPAPGAGGRGGEQGGPGPGAADVEGKGAAGAAVLHPGAQAAEAAEGLAVLWGRQTQVTKGRTPSLEPEGRMPHQARPKPPGDGSARRGKATQSPAPPSSGQGEGAVGHFCS